MRRANRILLIVLGALVVLVALGFGLLQTGFGKRQLLAAIEQQLAAPPARLQAQALEGVVPFDMRLVGATLSDRQGVWLTAYNLHLSWSPSSLLRGTLAIESIDADRIALARLPVSPPASPSPSPSSGPLLPRLPFALDLRSLSIDRLELGAPIIGEPAVFAVAAHARLGETDQALQAQLSLKRIDKDNDQVSLDLDYRPESDSLRLDATAEEPQGGLVTRLLGFAGAPKFTARIQGDGPLTQWMAKGSAQLDDSPLLDVTATSNGPAADRRVAFDLALAQIQVLPADLAPLIAGGIKAQGKLHLTGADRPIAIESLTLETAAASLAAKGTVDPAGSLDVTAELHNAGSAPLATLLPPDLSWRELAATVRLAGPVMQPKAQVDAAIAGLDLQGNRIGHADVSAAAVLALDADRVQGLTAAINARDIALAETRFQPLVADGVTLDLAGAFDFEGGITADSLALKAGALSWTGSGSAAAWGEQAAHLDGTLAAADLAHVLAFAGLQGGGQLSATITADKSGAALSADMQATTEKLQLGIPALDRLLGGTTQLAVNARRDEGGAIAVKQAALQSESLDLALSGNVSAAQDLDLKAEGKLAELGRVVSELSGGLALSGTIGGTMADPSAKLEVVSAQLGYRELKVADLRAGIDAANLLTTTGGRVQATARVNGLAASMAARVELPEGRVNIADLRAGLGTATVTGNLNLAGKAIAGAFDVAVPNLAELTPLTGQALSGGMKAAITLDAKGGTQAATVKAAAQSLRLDATAIEGATLSASATDLFSADSEVDATLTATGISAGGQRLDRLDARAVGPLEKLSVTAEAKGPEASLATAATIAITEAETRISLAKLDLAAKGVKATLQRPAEIRLRPGSTEIAGLALQANGGTLSLDARLAPDASMLSVKLTQLPLSLLQVVAPDQQYLGTLDGTLALEGPKTAPTAALKLQGHGLGVVGASEQLADLDLTGAWQGGRWSSDGRLSLSKASALDFSAAFALPAGPDGLPAYDPMAPLQASAKGQVDLGIANAFIPGGADHVAGRATIDLLAAGAIGAPVLSGAAQVADGRYDNQRYGTRLRKITAAIEGIGSSLRVTSLTATTPGGGTLSGEGNVDFAGAMPVSLAIRMDRARVLDAPIGTAVTAGTLDLTGTLGENLKLSGKVKIVKAEIRIPDRLPVDVEEIPVKEVNLPPERAAMMTPEDAPPPKSLAIVLDVAVSAPQQVFVRGRGLDAELGGDLKIGGTADAPAIAGALNLRRGDFNLLSRRLQFSRGTVTFSDSRKVDPLLDFLATTKLPDADVTVTVTGTAAKPVIAFSSSPPLPQDEILARLLFGKASGALSPFEAVQLAQAMADLAGISTGPNVLDKLRKGLGLDRLDIESGEGASTAPSLSAGRYISRGVFLGAKQGATPNSSAATVEIELSPNVKLETEVGADSSKTGVNLEWNY